MHLLINKELLSKELTIELSYKNRRGEIDGLMDAYLSCFSGTYVIFNIRIKVVFHFMRYIFQLFFILSKDKKVKLISFISSNRLKYQYYWSLTLKELMEVIKNKPYGFYFKRGIIYDLGTRVEGFVDEYHLIKVKLLQY